jgi:Leucine-rich repeat (LRR) protein
MSLHKQTDGTNWTHQDNWKQTKTPCDWTGITCTDGHVTQISLADNNLVGTLPDLSALTSLQLLDLRHNHLTGTIVGLNENLQKLLVGDNQMFAGTLSDRGNNQIFSSEVFPNLSSLTNLQQLGLAKNQLTGSLATLISKLPTHLKIIQLDQNQLTGDIPDFKDFTELEILKLHSNQLSGSIPHFGHLTNLQTLWLSGNQLTGEIPDSLINFKQLDNSVNLDLRYNQLTPIAEDSERGISLKETNLEWISWVNPQTVSAQILEAVPKPQSGTEIELVWTPPAIQVDNNFYQVKYARDAKEKLDRNIASHTIKGLVSGQTYHLVVETVTPPHNYNTLSDNTVEQQNHLVSASEAVSVKTLEAIIEVSFSDQKISNGGKFSRLFEGDWNPNLNASPEIFRIINSGDITLNLGSIEPMPGFIAEFRTTDNQTKLFEKPALAPNGGTVYLAVGLDTRAPGRFNTEFNPELSFSTNDLDKNPFHFTLRGLVKAPEIDLELLKADGTYTPVANDDEPIDFGETLQRSENVPTSNRKTFRIINNGQLPLKISPLKPDNIIGSGFNLTPGFELEQSLAPNEAVTFEIELDTRTVGQFSREISFDNNDFDENPYHIAFKGTVTTPEIKVFMDDKPIAHHGRANFGNTLIKKDIVKTFVVQNTGQGDLYLFPPVKLENTNGTFVWEKDFNRTIIPPKELATFKVKLDTSRLNNNASGVIDFNGNISVTNNDNNKNPFTFSIEGQVIIPTQDCKAEIFESECNVLLKLYQDTDGPNWTNSPANNWLQTDKPCNWTGITCSSPIAPNKGNNAKKSHVTKIELANNNLRGSLPDLAALKALETLSLGNSHLTGSIPNLSELKQLRFLDLSGNQLTGSLPAPLKNLNQLERLALHNNQLSGEIPEVSNLLNLQELVLSDNQLTGEVPKDLNNLSQLEILRLEDNQLKGPIPDVSSLANLKELSLDNNFLTGPIPVELSQLVNLEQLQLGNNHLTGSIPAELSQLVNLKQLQLGNNHLIGSIPAEFSQLVNLEQLQLESNQLRGEIPPSFMTLVNLTQLDLDFNRLTMSAQHTELQRFIGEKALNWPLTQTISPTDVVAKALSATEVQLNWTPILYTDDGGYYQVRALNREEPFKNTADEGGKMATDTQINGLSPNTTYCFGVETYTPTHSEQQNALTSEPSAETCITTYSMYLSRPNPGEILDMGRSEVGHPTTTVTLTILEMGSETLTITESELTGEHAHDFAIMQGEAPFSIADGEPDHSLVVQCLPSEPLERRAILTLTTNDPEFPRVTYPLRCEGRGPIYSSKPLPKSLFVMSRNELGNPTSTNLTVFNLGNALLEVHDYHLTGSSADAFRITREVPAFQISENGLSRTMRLECIPPSVGEHTGILTFETNDLNYPEVSYFLKCVNRPLFQGEIITEAGDKGSVLGIDAPETVTLIGRIFPPTQHIGQIADILMTYHWTPYDNGKSLEVPLTIATQQFLEKEMEMNLFDGTLIGLAGFFQVDLGYRLNGNESCTGAKGNLCSGEIATLEVRPNNEPTCILFDGLVESDLTSNDTENSSANRMVDLCPSSNNRTRTVSDSLEEISETLNTSNDSPEEEDLESSSEILPTIWAEENSPPNTLIGTFTTLDADKGDWFVYGFVEKATDKFKPSRYFKIVANELRVRNGFVLDFESGSQYDLTLRSVDASGDFLAQIFRLQIKDMKPQASNDIRLTNKNLPEHSLNNDVVGRFISGSREPGEYEYVLTDDAQGLFKLNDQGVLMVADSDRLALEERSDYSVTVKSQLNPENESEELHPESGTEQDFTIEIINLVDVSVEVDIQDTRNGTLLESPLSLTDNISIMLHIIPDISHREANAHLLLGMMSLFPNRQVMYVYIEEDLPKWGEPMRLFSREPITLLEKHDVKLWEGPVSEVESWLRSSDDFTGLKLEIYLGYCLVPPDEMTESEAELIANEVEMDLHYCFTEEGLLFHNSEPVVIEVK